MILFSIHITQMTNVPKSLRPSHSAEYYSPSEFAPFAVTCAPSKDTLNVTFLKKNYRNIKLWIRSGNPVAASHSPKQSSSSGRESAKGGGVYDINFGPQQPWELRLPPTGRVVTTEAPPAMEHQLSRRRSSSFEVGMKRERGQEDRTKRNEYSRRLSKSLCTAATFSMFLMKSPVARQQPGWNVASFSLVTSVLRAPQASHFIEFNPLVEVTAVRLYVRLSVHPYVRP